MANTPVAKTDVRVVIITGVSGSGKSTAIRALEDLGFFCIDNLPIPLLKQFIFLWEESAETVKQVALGVDVRERVFLAQAVQVFEELQASGTQVEICYLEAEDDVLARRFQETRRKHPLAGRLDEGIAKEHELLQPLRDRAHLVIDTSFLNIHQLKRIVGDRFGNPETNLQVLLMSFGFKFGMPRSIDYLFDVRYLSNPYFVDSLRNRTGLDAEVQDYVMQQEVSQQLITHLDSLLRFSIEQTNLEGRSRLTIAIGCTGGKHRSVTLVEKLNKRLSEELPVSLSVLHRDIRKVKS